MRICLIGLPRCGSQYISSMLGKSVLGMRNLIEPFTRDHNYSIVEKNNLIQKTQYFNKFNSYEDQINYVIATLKKGKITQPLVLKIFLTSNIFPFLEEIITQLKNLDFKFLIIKRENIEYQLLSWLIAKESNKWSTDDGEHTNPLTITDLSGADWLYSYILKFDKLIKQYNIDAETIRYEYALEDLFKYLQISIQTNIPLKKQITGNPYEMIENASEVRTYIKELLHDTTIH